MYCTALRSTGRPDSPACSLDESSELTGIQNHERLTSYVLMYLCTYILSTYAPEAREQTDRTSLSIRSCMYVTSNNRNPRRGGRTCGQHKAAALHGCRREKQRVTVVWCVGEGEGERVRYVSIEFGTFDLRFSSCPGPFWMMVVRAAQRERDETRLS